MLVSSDYCRRVVSSNIGAGNRLADKFRNFRGFPQNPQATELQHSQLSTSDSASLTASSKTKMAKSKNSSQHNQSKKNHRNGYSSLSFLLLERKRLRLALSTGSRSQKPTATPPSTAPIPSFDEIIGMHYMGL